MELMENIIFLFIQQESNCWYSAKKKKKPTLGQTVAFFFFSAVNESMQLYMCVCPYLFLPKSLWTPDDSSFLSNAPVFICCSGSNRVLFSYLYCILANSVSVGLLAVRLTIVLFILHHC